MFRPFQKTIRELSSFLVLWLTQSFSALGSAMTGYALVIWSYQQQGSALSTALLSVCTYAPYVLLSIFAGALSDRWNKRALMLTCDSLAALSTVAVLVLLSTHRLRVEHLYLINALNGLMNTVQQPASELAVTLLTPREHYQRVSGLRSFSHSLETVLSPVLATAMLAFAGLRAVLWFDLASFGVAFVALAGWVRIPKPTDNGTQRESVLASARGGVRYLRRNPGILHLILFLSIINLTASIYNAALPAMLLSRAGGGAWSLGAVNAAIGVAMLTGSVLVTVLPAPKHRSRVILNALFFSMSTENFILAFGRSTPVWCLGAVLGWLFIPMMGANMDALFRLRIPVSMQGRVYAARNTFQFFTIPVGFLLGGLLVDRVFEPLMALQPAQGWLSLLFGVGKGSGAALLFFVIGIFGALSCLPFRADAAIRGLDNAAEVDAAEAVEPKAEAQPSA